MSGAYDADEKDFAEGCEDDRFIVCLEHAMEMPEHVGYASSNDQRRSRQEQRTLTRRD